MYVLADVLETIRSQSGLKFVTLHRSPSISQADVAIFGCTVLLVRRCLHSNALSYIAPLILGGPAERN